MINIKPINLGLSVANGVDWYIPNYKSNLGEAMTLIATLYKDGEAIKNWNDTPIGLRIGIPIEVQNNWGEDDTVIDDFVLQAIGATRE
jgi:hypothetical protein